MLPAHAWRRVDHHQSCDRVSEDIQLHLLVVEGLALLTVGEDDPDDTLFLQITQKELAMVGLGMTVAKYFGFINEVNALGEKVIAALEAQKEHWEGDGEDGRTER